VNVRFCAHQRIRVELEGVHDEKAVHSSQSPPIHIISILPHKDKGSLKSSLKDGKSSACRQKGVNKR
jgi:hypothetical protein